jgi:hypothetical protein
MKKAKWIFPLKERTTQSLTMQRFTPGRRLTP